MSDDRYGGDVLANFRRQRGPAVVRQLPIEPGLVIEERATGFVGAVMRYANGLVELANRHGAIRSFPLGAGYLVDGHPVTLVKPVSRASAPQRTASGSLAVADSRARVARPSRIFVEGRHDAELVERVWGDDLRVEGVAARDAGRHRPRVAAHPVDRQRLR